MRGQGEEAPSRTSYVVASSPPLGGAALTPASQIEHNIDAGPAAADQEIAVRRGRERLDEIIDCASDEAGFAIVADAGSTRPPHRHIAGLGQFQKALKRRIPMQGQTASGEGHHRSGAGGAVGQMRRPERSGHDARGHRRSGAEILAVQPLG